MQNVPNEYQNSTLVVKSLSNNLRHQQGKTSNGFVFMNIIWIFQIMATPVGSAV